MAEEMSSKEKERKCQEIADKTGKIMYLDEGGIRMAFFPTNKEIEAIRQERKKKEKEISLLFGQKKISLEEADKMHAKVLDWEETEVLKIRQS